MSDTSSTSKVTWSEEDRRRALVLWRTPEALRQHFGFCLDYEAIGRSSLWAQVALLGGFAIAGASYGIVCQSAAAQHSYWLAVRTQYSLGLLTTLLWAVCLVHLIRLLTAGYQAVPTDPQTLLKAWNDDCPGAEKELPEQREDGVAIETLLLHESMYQCVLQLRLETRRRNLILSQLRRWAMLAFFPTCALFVLTTWLAVK